MPSGDGTGPVGRGPMTGRAVGYCAGYQIPGYSNSRGFGVGRGFFGRGRGRGLGRGFWGRGRGFWWKESYPDSYSLPMQSIEEEKIYLENTVKDLEEEIKTIHERIKELSKEKKENP